MERGLVRRTTSTGLIGVLVAALMVILAGPARAATIDGGQLTPGVEVAMDASGLGDVHVYRLPLAAWQRVVLQPGTTSGYATATAFDDATGAVVASGKLGRPPGSYVPQALSVASVGTARTLRFELTIAATAPTIPFTPTVTTEAAPTPLAWNTPTTLTLAPQTQTSLAFDGIAGQRLGITITGTFTNPLAVGAMITDPNGQSASVRVTGATVPAPMMVVGTYTLRFSTGAVGGTVTVLAQAVPDITGTITSGADETVDLATVFTEYHKTVMAVPGARLRLDVVSSTLHHTDGAPGSADVFEDDGHGLTQFGRVSNQPVTIVSGYAMTAAAPRAVVIRTDGLTTGTLTLRWTVQPDYPPVAAAPSVDIAALFDLQGATRSYTVATSGAHAVLVQVKDVALSRADGGSPGIDLTMYPVLPDGSLGAGTTVGFAAPGSPLSATVDTSASTSWVFTLNAGAATGNAVVRFDPFTTAAGALSLGQSTAVTVSATNDAVTFSFPGGGATPSLVVDAMTVSVPSGWPVRLPFTFSQAGHDPVSGYSIGADAVGTTFPIPATIDPGSAWQLTAPLEPGSTGTVAFTLRLPTTTSVTRTLGTTTRVSFAAAGDATAITFRAPAGKRVVIQASNATTLCELVLTSAAGAELARTSDGYLEAVAPSGGGSLLLTARLAGYPMRPGSVDLRITAVTDPVTRLARTPTVLRWTAGQNPVGLFDAARGRQAVLSVTASSWTPSAGFPILVVVRAPSGAVVFSDRIDSGWTGQWTLPRLTESGTYRLQLDPAGPSTGSITVGYRLS